MKEGVEMQWLGMNIHRLLYVAAVVMVGGPAGQASAADAVALLQNDAGHEAHREQDESASNGATSQPEVDRAFFDIKWHAYSSANTIQLNVSPDTTRKKIGVMDSLMKIVRPRRLSTVFNVPVELDVFGVAKRFKSKAITIHPSVKPTRFKLSVSCPL